MDVINWLMNYLYDLRKYNYYVSTLTGKYLYYELFGGTWWTRIDRHLILGGIPLHNLNHLEALKQEQVSAVVCILERFELNPTFYFNPISMDDWNNNQIDVLQLETEDTTGVKLDNMMKAVDFISQYAQAGKTVYIHCKAGKGRSASIVLAYLLYQRYKLNQHISITDVIDLYNHLRQLRQEIHINTAQFVPILDYVEYLMKQT